MIKYCNKIVLGTIITLCSLCISAATVAPQPSNSSKLQHKEILTHLLTADLALKRNMLDEALANYLIVAKATEDPAVAQLATEIALELQDPQKSVQAAEIWGKVDPTNLQAQLVALTLFLNYDPDKANQFLENAFIHHADELDQNLISVLEQLPTTGRKRLTAAVLKLATKNPNSAYAQLYAAEIAAVQLDLTTANQHLKQALALKPDLTNAIQLNAKIISHEKNDDKPALEYLNTQVTNFPKDANLRMFYVLALIDNEQSKQALPHLNILSKDKEYGGDAFLLIGESNINDGKYTEAEKNITKALGFENSIDKARYYLAQLAEHNKKEADAITWYEQVESTSDLHTAAFLRAAYLYSLDGDYTNALNTLQNSSPNTFDDQKQILLTEIDILIDANDLEKALENSNRIVAVLPNDVDFLYARSVVLGLMKKYGAAERDLLTVIQIEPENANALNALGFILSNQPDRVQEAKPYIQKAIGINPNNPAFMDTMGWYLFKTGNTQDAIAMLENAYKLSGDTEIAAHLGEVLWAVGKKSEAKAIWQQALQSSENKQIIQETLTRLNIPMTDVRVNAQ